MAIGGGDGSIILTTKVDTSGVNKGMSSIKNIVGKVGGVIAAAFSVRALINFGKEAINLASDLQEVQNVVDSAFGSMAYKIEKFAETAIYNFGISKLSAKQWASTMMAMGSGMGQAMEVGSDMAVELTGRLADVMSFYNKTEEEAFTLGKAIYSGETEPLKNIGVIMTETNLELFALQKGYSQTYKSMDAANKLLVRQQFFLEKTSLAAGDYVKTQDGWANSTRTLQQRWKEMQTEFGKTFMAIGTILLPAVNTLISAMTKLATMTSTAWQNIYRIFTGKTLENVENSSTNAADGVTELGNATADAQKKIDKSLATFDELDILSSNIASNMSSGTNDMTMGMPGNITEKDIDYMKEAEKVNAALSYIMALVGARLIAVGLLLLFNGHVGWGIGFIIAGAYVFGISAASLMGEDVSQNAANALASLMGVIGGALVAVGIVLCWLGSWAWGIGFIIAGATALGVGIATIGKFGTENIVETLMYIQGIASGAMLGLGIILLVFGGANPLSIGLIIAGASSLAISTAEIISGEVEQDIANMINGIVQMVSVAFLFLGVILLATPLKGAAVGFLIAGASGLVSEVALNWEDFKTEMQGELGAIVRMISTFALFLGIILLFTPLKTTGIGLIALGVFGLVADIALNWEELKNELASALNSIVAVVSRYLLALGIILLFTPMKNLGLGIVVAGAIGLVASIAMNPENFINEVVKFLTTLTQVIIAFSLALGVILLFNPATMAQGIGLIVAGLGGFAFLSMVDIDGSHVEEKISNELESINDAATEGVNNINNTLSGIGFSDGSNYNVGIGSNMPNNISYSVPKLARGAVLPPNKPFLSVVGDQKSGINIETPLDTMVQAFNIALDSRNNSGGGSTPVVLEIDGRVFGKAVIDEGNRAKRRMGTSLVVT